MESSPVKICKTCGESSNQFYRGHSSCKSCVKLRQLEWYKNNKQRNYENSRTWKLANPERNKEVAHIERNTPSAKLRQRGHNLTRIARRKNAEGSFKPSDIRALMEKQNGCCNHCDCDIRLKYHIDHVIALVNGGSNWPHNLQLLCPTCNMRKGSGLTQK